MPGYKRWIARCLTLTSAFWLALVLIPSFPAFRLMLASPLVVSDDYAEGDAAYVLSAGYAFRERLSAAADLYQMGRVPRIILLRDNTKGAYSFRARSNWTPTEWGLDFLLWRGIPKDKIVILPDAQNSRFGTLNEARMAGKALPSNIKRLVLAHRPHIRGGSCWRSAGPYRRRSH